MLCRHMPSTRVMTAICNVIIFRLQCYVVICRLHVLCRHMPSTRVMAATCAMSSYEVYMCYVVICRLHVLWHPYIICHCMPSTCVMSSYAVYTCYGIHMCYVVNMCYGVCNIVLWRLHMCYDHTCVTLFSVMVSSSMTTGVCESTKRETILC